MVAQRKHQSRIRLIRPVKGGEDRSGGSVNRAARAGQQASPCRGELKTGHLMGVGGGRESPVVVWGRSARAEKQLQQCLQQFLERGARQPPLLNLGSKGRKGRRR